MELSRVENASVVALKTGKWEGGFCSIQFLFKFDVFGAFLAHVRGGALRIGWGARSTWEHTNTQTHSLFARRTTYMFHSTRALSVRLNLELHDTLNRNKCVYSATGE